MELPVCTFIGGFALGGYLGARAATDHFMQHLADVRRNRAARELAQARTLPLREDSHR